MGTHVIFDTIISQSQSYNTRIRKEPKHRVTETSMPVISVEDVKVLLKREGFEGMS